MKRILLITALLASTQVFAQNVGINATGAAPAASAMLDVVSTNRGVLIPRVALTATNAAGPVAAPAVSLLVYNTATAGTAPNNVTPGYYYWNGAAWVRFMQGNGDAWITTGNTGTNPTTNFIGTTDNQSFVIRTNNVERIRVLNTGNTGLGTATPAEQVHATANVRADGIVYWGNGLVRTETRNDAGLQGSAGSRSGFFETSAPAPAGNWPVGAASWWHLLDVRHSNNGNNYAMQFAGSFFDQVLYFRKTNGAANTPWSRVLTSNDGWMTTGNAGTNPTNNFVGTTDNQSFVVRTNNAERMRVFNTGQVGVNTPAGSAGDMFFVTANAGNPFAVNGYTASPGMGVYGYSTGNTVFAAVQGEYGGANAGSAGVRGSYMSATAGTSFLNAAAGVNGQVSAAGTYKFGVVGTNTSAATTRTGGVIGNNANWSRGACGYFASNGADYGIYGFGIAYQAGVAGGMLPNSNIDNEVYASTDVLVNRKAFKNLSYDSEVNFASWSSHQPNANVGIGIYGGVMGGWIKGLVYGTNLSGTKYGVYVHGKTISNDVIVTLNRVPESTTRIATYAATSMKVDVTDKGKAVLNKGKGTVSFDSDFSKLLSSDEPIIITVTPLGPSKGLYIEKSSTGGFTVIENDGGNSDVEFYWIAVGVKSGFEQPRISSEIIDSEFEEKMNGNGGIMFNDNNPAKPTYSIWYDGRDVRFDTPPNNRREPIDLNNNRTVSPK